MSMKLSLVDSLLDQAQRYYELGQTQLATRLLSRLASFRKLPASVAEPCQALLAELALDRGDPKQARRHLTVALRYQPLQHRLHYLYAQAIVADDEADPQAAVKHFRRALEIEPDQPYCLSEFGHLLVTLGQIEAGLAALRSAVEKRGDDAELLERLLDGLKLANRLDECRDVLITARFRNPRSLRVLQLWQQHRFEELADRQHEVRESDTKRKHSAPVLLPFIRVVHEPSEPTLWVGEETILRQDSAEETGTPNLSRLRSSRDPQGKRL